MVKSKKSKSKFYYIQCGDWDGAVLGKNPNDACINAISQSIERFSDNTKLTKLIMCMDCESSVELSENNIHAFLVESIMEKIYE